MSMSLSIEAGPVLRAALERVLEGQDLVDTEAEAALHALLEDDSPRALQAAFLTALRAKGETAAELAGFARGLLAHAQRLELTLPLLVDTCGTGGDGTHSFNLSSAAALLLAALGIPVAKHGNRAVSSRVGSAELFEALGIAFPASPGAAEAALERDGFAFLFAPSFHPALARLASLRRELGVRTVLNLLGPLVNPARPTHQLLGAATPALAQRLASAALALGLQRVFVVHGTGFDEATPCGPFRLWIPRHDGHGSLTLDPGSLGVARCNPEDLAGGDARENAERLVALFAGRERGPLRDAVCLNAALVLLLVRRERDPRAALEVARAALDDGRALRLLARLQHAGGRS